MPNSLKLKIKKLHPDAKIPQYAKPGDAGLDLVAISKNTVNKGPAWAEEGFNHQLNYIEYGTGLAFEIPEGHVGLIFPRSSIRKTGMSLRNSVGVIDSGYRGEVKFSFEMAPQINRKEYEVGEKVGQMIIMPFPLVEVEEVETLSESERGSGGYGSTGR